MAAKTRAETAARALLKEHRVTAPPVPVDKIAELLGIELMFRPFDGDVSGILRRDEGRTVIGVNSTEAPVRQRFTIAHELGHFKLHEGYEVIVDKIVRVNLRITPGGPLATRADEREANYFAAELLMPEALLRDRMRHLVGDRNIVSGELLVEQLAEEFEVSRQAMIYRLVNLELLDDLAIAGG